jgi:predicted extracellular nuclease
MAVIIAASGVSTEEKEVAGAELTMTASPNPFNPQTVITYVVPRTSNSVKLQVLNSAAKIVATLVDQPVTVQGVVVGDFQGRGQFNGYFIQEETTDQDADPSTSEGLFVNSTTAVSVGELVRITGLVAENFSRTQLNGVSQTIVCAHGLAASPVDVTLPFNSAVNNAEWFEGMLVTLPQTLTATEVFTLARFGEVSVSSGNRLSTPTHAALPGTTANSIAAANDLNRIIIDDGLNTQNPAAVRYPEPAGLSAGNTLRVGATVTRALGVMDFAFGAYRLQPTAAINFVPANQRPPMPELPVRGPLGGQVRVASFNVLNYFNTLDEPGAQCYPSNDRTQCRGADSAAEFARQRDKTIAAIRGLDADIVGLIEMENDGFGPESAIQDLVNGLNANDGSGAWAFVNPFFGTPEPAHQGTDAIKVALIYRTAVAAPEGFAAILDNSVDVRAIDTKNRTPMAQTFRSRRTNDRFTVVIIHFKSKGSDCNAAIAPGELNDLDLGDEQGNCNLTRLSLANALIDWLATDPTGSNDPDVIIMGDLNAYRMEDPIRALVGAGFTDVITALNGDETYSFVFQGESGYLDHALANVALRSQINAVTEWHINADEPVALDYNVEFKTPDQVLSFYAPDAFRAADHDPVIVQMLTAGDLDGDRDVDAQDGLILSRALGARSGTRRYIAEADYDTDGRIGLDDLARWSQFLRAYRAAVRTTG